MIIGFYINALTGTRKQAIDWISQNMFGHDVETASNIVDRTLLGLRTNVYGDNLNGGILAGAPFTSTTITIGNDITLVSLVDYQLELPYFDASSTLRNVKISPTGNVVVTRQAYRQLKVWVERKILRAYSLLPFDADLPEGDFEPADFATSDLL